jgi:hypothetical protein
MHLHSVSIELVRGNPFDSEILLMIGGVITEVVYPEGVISCSPGVSPSHYLG